MTDDIEVFKLVKLSSKKSYDNFEKESDKRNYMDMNYVMYYDERD